VQVYDYVDIHIPTLMRMYKKRLKGYDAIGYLVQNSQENQGIDKNKPILNILKVERDGRKRKQ